MNDDSKTKVLAKSLARNFSNGQSIGSCACNAPSCRELGCSSFWDYILNNPEHLTNALALYDEAKNLCSTE